MKVFKRSLSKVMAVAILATCISFQPMMTTKANAATVDSYNGDWSKESITLENTPEAALMARTGDIDNFGYTWQKKSGGTVDPFTGNPTDTHNYPFKPTSGDPDATDRIMVVSGYTGVNKTTDGYTSSTYNVSGYNAKVTPVTLNYDLKNVPDVKNATISMFLDDVQPAKWYYNGKTWANGGRGGYSCQSYTKYTVTFCIPGETPIEVPELEDIVNSVDQHGPIGNLVAWQVDNQYLGYLQRASTKGLQIKIDDPRVTIQDYVNGNKEIYNTGDGYAIDFVKIVFNRKDVPKYDGTVVGHVYEGHYDTNGNLVKDNAIQGAEVSLSGVADPVYTAADGSYSCNKVPAGQVIVTAEKEGYETGRKTIEQLIAGTTATCDDIVLIKTNKPSKPVITQDIYALTNQDVTITIDYGSNVQVKQYRIDGGQWQNYTGSFKVDHNCLIEAQSTRQIKVSTTETKEFTSDPAQNPVTNIDKGKPATATFQIINNDQLQKYGRTNQGFKVRVNYDSKYYNPSSNVNKIKEISYKLPNKDWVVTSDINQALELTINPDPALKENNNGEILLKYTTSYGNISDEASFVIDKFDFTAEGTIQESNSLLNQKMYTIVGAGRDANDPLTVFDPNTLNDPSKGYIVKSNIVFLLNDNAVLGDIDKTTIKIAGSQGANVVGNDVLLDSNGKVIAREIGIIPEPDKIIVKDQVPYEFQFEDPLKNSGQLSPKIIITQER